MRKDRKYRVYDNRTKETIFESDDKLQCALFIDNNFDENGDDFEHISLEKIPKGEYMRKVERVLYDYPSLRAGLENRDEMETMYPSLISSYEEKIRISEISKPTEKYGVMRAEKEMKVRQMKRALAVLNYQEADLVDRKYFNRRSSDEHVMLEMDISNTKFYKLKDQALRKVATALNII